MKNKMKKIRQIVKPIVTEPVIQPFESVKIRPRKTIVILVEDQKNQNDYSVQKETIEDDNPDLNVTVTLSHQDH